MSEIAHCGMAQDAESESQPGRSNAFAQAFGVATCAFAAGTVLGPVWAGLILTHYGWATMTWSINLLSVVAAVTSSLFISKDIDPGQ
jgi:MFS family permease